MVSKSQLVADHLSQYHLLEVGISYHVYFKKYTVWVTFRQGNGEHSLQLGQLQVFNTKHLQTAIRIMKRLSDKTNREPLKKLLGTLKKELA